MIVSNQFVYCLSMIGIVLFMGGPAASQELPELNPPGAPYHTPLAGQGFRTEVFGHEIEVQPRNRRSTYAWDLSFAFYDPGPRDSADAVPIGVLTFWNHPDDERLFRAQISGLYNEILWAKGLDRFGPLEGVLTFENFTIPVAQSELVDGGAIESEELVWGYVQPGFGLGYRRQIYPGHQDNMAAVDLTVEPGFLYFGRGSNTADSFVVPHDTFEVRAHLQTRVDGLVRNLLELPHQGIAAGTDFVYGYRSNWKDWGVNGAERADKGRRFQSYTGYFLAAGGIPGLDDDRHRLIGVVHAGIGHNVDRFSATRVGGGPYPMGEEYGTTAMPVLPGSIVQEFFPDHYLLFTAEYRWEPIFFVYLGLNGSIGRLDRLREIGGTIVKKDDTLTAAGVRLTSGFFLDTRLQLAYNYNFSVVRDGRYGGHEIIFNLAGAF